MLMLATPVYGQTPSPPSIAVEVTAPRVNLRAGPGTTHRIVGAVERGSILPVVRFEGTWALVDVSELGLGAGPAYVSRSLVREVTVEAPVMTAPAPRQDSPSHGLSLPTSTTVPDPEAPLPEVAEQSLTAAQRQNYTRLKLSLEVGGISEEEDRGGQRVLRNVRTWKAFEGFEPLSEQAFFRKAGYDTEAQRADAYRRSANRNMLVGVGLGLGGVLAMLYGATQYTGYESNYLDNKWVLGGAITGSIGTYMIRSGMKASDRNWAPYPTASAAAEAYNSRLRAEIAAGRR
jgi:hypothetical protein